MPQRVVRAPKDFWAGAFFVSFGLFFAFYALDYRIGNIHRLGPGMFPMLLGLALSCLGLLLLARSFINNGDPIPSFAFRSSAISLFAIVIFGLLIKPTGLVISTFVLIVLSGLAQPRPNILKIIALGAVTAAFCAVLFIGVIRLPISIWPSW